MSSQKKPVQCSRFEPQAWRKTLCKNCFKTRPEHTDEPQTSHRRATDELKAPDGLRDGSASPEVISGDKILIRRNLVTPPPDSQVTECANLGRRGSDVSSGRRTPTEALSRGASEERQRPTPIVEEQTRGASVEKRGSTPTVEDQGKGAFESKVSGGFRNVGKSENSSNVSTGFVKVPTGNQQSPIETSKKVNDSVKPGLQLEASSNKQEVSSVVNSQTTTALTGFDPGKASPSSTLPASLPPTSSTKISRDGEVTTTPRNLETGKLEEISTKEAINTDNKSKNTKQESDRKEPTNIESPPSINNSSSVGVGSGSHVAAGHGARQPGSSAPEPEPGRNTDIVHARAQNSDLAADKGDEKSAVSNLQTGSDCRSSGGAGQRDARTEIAQASAEPVGSSYVQSLRISLSSPINVDCTAISAAAAVEEPRNSYGVRHAELTQAAAANDVGACVDQRLGSAAGEPGLRASAAAAASAAAHVLLAGGGGNPDCSLLAQSNLAKSNSSDLSSEKTPFKDDCPVGLGPLNPQITGFEPCPQDLVVAQSGKAKDSREEGVEARPTSADEVVNNVARTPGTTSGYRYVDAGDSRVSYNIISEGRGDGGGGLGVTGSSSTGSSSTGSSPTGSGNHCLVTDAQGGTGTSGSAPPGSDGSSGQGSPTEQSRRKVTSLFHHVPGDHNGLSDDSPPPPPNQSCESAVPYRSLTDEEAAYYSSQAAQQQGGSSRRRRRSKVLSLDDDLGSRTMMNSFDYNRSDVMMEGTRMVMESLREKVAQLQEQIERQEREKCALGDLLAAKKNDYEMMKDHYNGTIGNLENEVQRLKSEKSRLLDKLQLPESERASLALEENEIADLKRRLEEYENRYTEVVGENEDLRQEVRDLQLEMEEMHDQFREEETIEFRELQKELENTAKNCRILQFKLRKSDRRIEQLESDRIQYEDKLRHFESCFQSSDDKRRIRVLEDDLRLARESAVRLHAELERAEDRRLKYQEELDRAKNSVNEADNKRLCLQNQLDSMKHEMSKLRDELRFDGSRPNVIKTGSVKISSPESDATVAQLTKDLKDSLERENDLKEQLKFAEEETITMRKKLLENEEETESMSRQLRKLSAAKSGRFVKGKVDESGKEQPLTERESELSLQMELAEQEVKVLKRKMDDLQQDNDNLLCAIKYLRSKLEQRDGVRSATPIGDTKNTKELLTRIGAPSPDEIGKDDVVEQLMLCKKEVTVLKDKIAQLEMENFKLLEECKKFQSPEKEAAKTQDAVTEKEKNLMKTIEELEQLLMQEKEKVMQMTNDKPTAENLNKTPASQENDLKKHKEELTKTKSDLETAAKELIQLKKNLTSAVDEATKAKEELKVASEMKSKVVTLQKTLADLQAENEKLLKEKEKPVTAGAPAAGAKEKEPASWRWEKQELEKQVKEFKKKFEDLQAEAKKPTAKTKDAKENGSESDSKKIGILSEECDQYKKQLEELKKKLAEVEENLKKKEKEKEKVEKELKKAMEKVSKEAEESLKSKQKDETTAEKKKLTKDLDAEKKRSDELTKEKERLVKEKEEWIVERKKLVQERDAAIKEKDDSSKEKSGKDSEDGAKRSTPFGMRSKVGLGGKVSDSAVATDSAKIKELTETLEKKEAELKALKAKVEVKGPTEKLGFQAREVNELKKDKERLEQDLEKSVTERKTLKSDIKELKEKLKSSEEAWKKEKVQLEQASENSRSSSKSLRSAEDSKSEKEKESLIKEKSKLTDEVTKLKKDLSELGKQKTSEKDDYEKKIKEKSKSLEESKASCDELRKQIERLKVQLESTSSKAASDSSKVVTIPVQPDRSVKSIPIQKISKSSSPSPSASSDEQDTVLQRAELVALEEKYRSRTKNLEDEINGLREQLASVQKDSEKQSQSSQKSFAELKTNFDKEFGSWNKERELLKKSAKQADDYAAKVSKLDKTVEDLNGKLKAEEAKRRELEVKLIAQENKTTDNKSQENKVNKTAPASEEKPKVPEEKTSTGQKASDFRTRFELFGGTPRPARKLSLPSTSSSTMTLPSDSNEKVDWVGEIQRQMTEAEKARLKDREELLEKLERQKKDFELKLEAFKETTKTLDAKSHELSALEKKMAEVYCQLEEERTNWAKERSKLQSKLTDSQKSGKDDKDKVAELMGEVKKLQVLASSGKGGTSPLSGTSTPLTPSTPLGTEKPGFRVKTPSSENAQNSSSGPVTSIVIPIRKIDAEKKVDVDKKAPADDGATATTPTSNGVGKLSKKLFPPFATESTPNASTTKSYTPGQRTPIPINRINRSNPK